MRLKPEQLRCPDCLNPRLSPHHETNGETHFTCPQCGRLIKHSAGILHALPKALNLGETENMHYYDEMSADEAGVLATRATTRNHKLKESTIRAALHLNQVAPASPGQPADAPRKVLEFGTGYGVHGAAVETLGHHYTGLDISAGLLLSARRRFAALAPADLVVADALRTPFQDAIFDAAFCVATLHHLPSPEAGVREMIRLLTPGGRFCILEPRRYYPTQLLQYLRHPQTEISAMQMVGHRVKKWAQQSGAREVTLKAAIFTPNRPTALIPIYNALDAALSHCPPLGFTSVMFCVSGSR